jgi:hypothetical protein
MEDNQSALAHQQELEHMELLLTKESYKKYETIITEPNITKYLKQHGLPLNSIIKGL